MRDLTRREFIGKSLVGAGALGAALGCARLPLKEAGTAADRITLGKTGIVASRLVTKGRRLLSQRKAGLLKSEILGAAWALATAAWRRQLLKNTTTPRACQRPATPRFAADLSRGQLWLALPTG